MQDTALARLPFPTVRLLVDKQEEMTAAGGKRSRHINRIFTRHYLLKCREINSGSTRTRLYNTG
jgi:hypothetical protein